jgi:hypothetical protein
MKTAGLAVTANAGRKDPASVVMSFPQLTVHLSAADAEKLATKLRASARALRVELARQRGAK